MRKYKVGDKVKVRKDLVLGRSYNSWHFVNSMARFMGKTVTIKSFSSLSGTYHIEEDGGIHGWGVDMFEDIKTKEEAKKATFKSLMKKEINKYVKTSNKDYIPFEQLSKIIDKVNNKLKRGNALWLKKEQELELKTY